MAAPTSLTPTSTSFVETHTLGGLADALWDDPFYVAIVASREGDAAKKDVLMKYLDYSMQEGRRTGRTVVTANGAATWSLPIADLAVAEAERVSKTAFMQDLLGEDYGSYIKINEFMSGKTDSPLYGDAWYLSILGVDPAHQKCGIGRRLLDETLLEADANGVDCFLETFDDNKGFYEKFGFESLETHFIPHIQAEYTIMVRKHGAATRNV